MLALGTRCLRNDIRKKDFRDKLKPQLRGCNDSLNSLEDIFERRRIDGVLSAVNHVDWHRSLLQCRGPSIFVRVPFRDVIQ